MTGVKGNLPTVSLDTLTRRASFHLIALAALIRLFFWLTRPTKNYADHVQSSQSNIPSTTAPAPRKENPITSLSSRSYNYPLPSSYNASDPYL